MNNDLLYYVAFSHFYGIGPVRFSSLIKYFGTVKQAYFGSKSEIKQILGDNIGEKFYEFKKEFEPEKKIEELNKKNINILTQKDKKYPPSLINIPDPPICLYVKGNLDQFNFKTDIFFAIVGTRMPTSYGQQITKKIASELVRSGFVIVSGMALGIDSYAHWGALDADGKTIAVLGCGVDIVYPSINNKLYLKIINGRGWIVSEFPPGHLVKPGLFVARNRIISGLSCGVLVIEGTKNSGSLITVKYAAQQGREVFAIPCPLTSKMSEAPNLILKQGAKLVTSVTDILEEFNLKVSPNKRNSIEVNLNKDEKAVFDVILKEAKLVNEIIVILNQPVDRVLHILSTLEIKGVIEKNTEGKYQVKIN